MEQTGKNFVYPSEILDGLKVTIDADNQPLRRTLDDMFSGTGIKFKIKGDNVVLKRKKSKPKGKAKPTAPALAFNFDAEPESEMLNEVIVVSRLEAPAVQTPEIGAKKITAAEVANTPALLGESDVIKTLQTEPGISEGLEGMASMHVHGGSADENLCMLDNVPLYQVNHFAGLFSAFNPDAIRYIDFYKSSVPAKYDGRLSSFMDVRLKNGSADGHHGTAKLGISSGAFSIGGPIGGKTTYHVAMRRSWYDLLTSGAVLLVNSTSDDEKIRFRYAFTDCNARVCHRFSDRATAFVSAYFGQDVLRTGSSDKPSETSNWQYDEKYDLDWGNIVAQAGLNYQCGENITSEFTAAYTRYHSSLMHDDLNIKFDNGAQSSTRLIMKTNNNINDWIARCDFDWTPRDNSRVRFGASFVRHSYLPGRNYREYGFDDTKLVVLDSVFSSHANEANAYVEDDIEIGRRVRINAGAHATLFNIDGKTYFNPSPRISASFRPTERIAIKAAYARTTQHVHQISQSYLSMPVDQWLPVTGKFKPQTADKVSLGLYWQDEAQNYAVSVEAYYKSMRNIIDFCDEYYLKPPLEMWNARLVSGRGTAKGFDIKAEKQMGKLTGQASYSLAWADRTFPEKNGGKTYPARFDNRHTIKLSLSWDISPKVRLNAAWIGRSGNRVTLMTQAWYGPPEEAYSGYIYYKTPLRTSLNNYRLPFYHRLDISCMVKNRHGYWSFGLYNAYCHLNTIAIRLGHDKLGNPVFQKVKLLPVIPSISYTWQF